MIIDNVCALEVGDDVYIKYFKINKIRGISCVQKFWARFIFVKYTPGTFYFEVKCDDDRLPDLKGITLIKDISVIYNEPQKIK